MLGSRQEINLDLMPRSLNDLDKTHPQKIVNSRHKIWWLTQNWVKSVGILNMATIVEWWSWCLATQLSFSSNSQTVSKSPKEVHSEERRKPKALLKHSCQINLKIRVYMENQTEHWPAIYFWTSVNLKSIVDCWIKVWRMTDHSNTMIYGMSYLWHE